MLKLRFPAVGSFLTVTFSYFLWMQEFIEVLVTVNCICPRFSDPPCMVLTCVSMGCVECD